MNREFIAALLEMKITSQLARLPANFAAIAKRSMQTDFLLRR